MELFFMALFFIWGIYENCRLRERNEKLLKDIEKLDKELGTLKLLNKLCVDSDGNLIKGVDYKDNV